jgi:hypothetical protein
MRLALINTLNNSQIDEAILSVTPTSWRKVAVVIGMTAKHLGDNLPKGDTGLDPVADRMEAVVYDGRLLAQGDLKKWRHSEVRKPISN